MEAIFYLVGVCKAMGSQNRLSLGSLKCPMGVYPREAIFYLVGVCKAMGSPKQVILGPMINPFWLLAQILEVERHIYL